ncbi:DUF3488 and transglutaminase-like domain-containing protein [Nonomuraea dietziae]|uniref:DUF3488 and transglutaminase-like domain-containing protein n=1 Tax=Nonomuraea dietziae TaxID=65515 RepID=UPI00341DDCD5
MPAAAPPPTSPGSSRRARGTASRRRGRRDGARVAEVALWRRIAGPAVVAALAATAGWGFHRVFPAADLLAVVVPSALVPAVVAALTRNRPLWLALVLDVVLWLAATVPLYGAFTLAFASDLTNSWQALLTTLLPAPAEPRLLILTHTLVWLAAVTGAETLTRTRLRIAPALPALLVYGVALVLGVDGEGSNLATSAALLVMVGLLLVLREDRPALWLLPVLPAIGVVTLVAVLLGPVLPMAREPYDPRRDAELPPPVRVDSVSPLDRVSAWLQIPDRPLFTVKADKPLNWRLAVLDRYDGVRWTSGGRFQPTGGRVTSDAWTGATTTVRQTVTFQGLPGTWLPAADRPVEVKGARGLAADPESGALLTSAATGKGFTYQVTSEVAAPTKDELLHAVPVADPGLTAFPVGPQEKLFRKLAQDATRGADVPIRQAYRLQNFLRTTAKYDITAPPGHSLKALEFFLDTTYRGTSEQFASSFALMARTLGLPARVVVGFRPGQAKDGVYHVRSGDVMAWAEIKFDKLGWRPFYPTPGKSGAKDDHDVVSSAIEESEQLEGEFGQSGASKAKEPAPKGKPVPVAESTSYWWVIAPVVVAAYLLLALVLPWWRRRSRRVATPDARRVMGAWHQACQDLGVVGKHSLTASEIVARHPAVEELQPLAALANHVRYAPDTLPPHAATEAWRYSDAIRAHTRRTTPLRTRLTHRLNPKTLIRP